MKNFLFNEKEWSGFTWLLKLLIVYAAAGAVVTLLYNYSATAKPYIAPLLYRISFPVYVLVFGLLLGVPAFNLSKAAVTRFSSMGKGLPILLAIIALYCTLVIIPQIILSRMLPIFTSVLVMLLFILLFLAGCGVVLRVVAGKFLKRIK